MWSYTRESFSSNKLMILLKRMMAIYKYNSIYKKYKEFTMIPTIYYLQNLDLCEQFKNVEGDVVECGVWRGGMIAGMADILGSERTYHLFDSFEGLPEAKEIDGKAAIAWQNDKDSPHYFDNCKAEMEFAQQAMKLCAASNFQIVKGWFSETLPNYKFDRKIAILRLDGDWYDSTIECFNYLYPHVADGGLIIIDDYYVWDGCSKAVHDYLSTHKVAARIYQSAPGISGVCYIIKRNT